MLIERAGKLVTREDIKRVRDMTDRPFGVNLPIAYVQDPSIADMLVEEHIPYVTTSAGSPMAYTPVLKAAGVTVLHVVTSLDTAMEAVDVAAVTVRKAFSSYRTDGGHASAQQGWPAAHLLMLAVLTPLSVGAMFTNGR